MLQQQLETLKARSAAMFKQMAEKHAREVEELEKSHEATLASMEARRCVQPVLLGRWPLAIVNVCGEQGPSSY